MKYLLAKLILWIITRNTTIQSAETAPVKSPQHFLTFDSLPSEKIMKGLVKAYQVVFAGPPWFETWTSEEVEKKAKKELVGDSFLNLSIKRGNNDGPITEVTGFVWGAIIPIEEIPERVAYALKLNYLPEEIIKVIGGKDSKKVAFFDEFAIPSTFRTGIEPVRFLLRPALEKAYKEGVYQIVFWSTAKSNIVPLALWMGSRPIYTIKTGEKEIIFFLLPDFRPLLKISQSFERNEIARIMKKVSKFLPKDT